MTAFSIASAPLLTNSVFLANVPGDNLARRSASETYDSYGRTEKHMCEKRSACACTAATTDGTAWPTFITPMPPAKSR